MSSSKKCKWFIIGDQSLRILLTDEPETQIEIVVIDFKQQSFKQ